ncbi:OprD family outer membrane porin [Pseudomonas duriflava]|uniref:OprD family outer membrane porin n=1 Tax=Pseudomonas duriflava TaxID=459528 RepID=UPI0013158846
MRTYRPHLQSGETERPAIVSYVVESGPLKGIGLRWMNIGVDTKNSAKYEENRLYVTYTYNIWRPRRNLRAGPV